MPLQLQTLKMLDTLDTDRNRSLTARELQKIDTSGDQQISREEALKAGLDLRDLLYLNTRYQKGLAQAKGIIFNFSEWQGQKIAADLNAIFTQLDQDGNGRISQAESARAIGNPDFKGDQAAAVTTLYKLMGDFQGYSDDTQVLPKLPDHPWLNKIPLQTYDERGMTRKDLDVFAETAGKVPLDARVSEAFGRHSMSVPATASGDRNKLFPKGIQSIRPDRIEQGEIGDCYFLAAVASLANTPRGRQQIFDMIQDHGQDRYTVTFPGQKPVTFTAPTQMERALYSQAGQDGLWLSVLEKAYAELSNRNAWLPLLQTSNPYDKIGSGAQLFTGVGAVTGKSTDTDMLWLTSADTLRAKLKNAFAQQRIVTAGIGKSLNPFGDGNTANGLPTAHAYSVLAYDAKTDQVTVRNPWGHTEVKDARGKVRDGVNDGTFKMPLSEFMSTFSMVCYQAA
jgi:hypothetical protein